MSHKMYVGNLSYSVEEDHLKDLFQEFELVSVKIIRDRDTGRSKGFGFVEVAEESQLDDLIDKHNGQDFEGRSLKLDKARDKPEGNRGGGGGRGGYGGGGGRGGRGGGGYGGGGGRGGYGGGGGRY